MNFLAHLFLADDTDDAILGNLLGDFVKGDPAGRYNAAITDGIIFHRKVDSFADSHTATRISRNRISPQRRRFAGIIVDVCYDHFLAKHWHEYNDYPLDQFTQRIYHVLKANRRLLPRRLKRMLGFMIPQDWLGGYRRLQWVGITLDRIAGRLSRGHQFKGAIAEVRANYMDLESDFTAFLPYLIAYAGQLKYRPPRRPMTVRQRLDDI